MLKSDDIWSLVKTNAATLRSAPMRAGKTKTMMSCKQAATDVIEPAFGLEIASLEKKYVKTDIGEAGQANYVQRSFERLSSNLKKNIELSFKSYVGSEAGAEQLIHQLMMINKTYANST